MTSHEELLARLDTYSEFGKTAEQDCVEAAAAIRSLEADLQAERKMRTVVETDCANERKAREEERHALIAEGRKWQERAEAAEREGTEKKEQK